MISHAHTDVKYLEHEEDDPLVGKRRETDSQREAQLGPDEEVAFTVEPHGDAVKSRAIAGWLGVLFGWLGAHRFYLGYHEIGGFQLALTAASAAAVFIGGVTVNPEASAFDLSLTAIGVVSLVWIWGLFEGVAIFIGGLAHDARLRPLK